jgi:WD40 repeat protein
MKNVFIFFLVLILSQFVSVAAIIYTDIDPDTLINGDGVTSGQIVYNVDIDNSNNHTGQWDGDLMLTLNKVDANNYYIDMFLSYNLSVEVVVNPDYYDYAAALEKNVSVNSQSSWKADYGSAINMEDAWNNQKDKFIGVRYKKSGSWQYGWVRLDISNNYTDFTVKDFAFQDDADAGINTGEGIETNPVENNYSDTVWIQSQTTIAKMSPSGYYICTGDNNSLKLLKAIDGSEVWNKNTDATIVGLTISNNNRFIATSHTDLKIRVWELETGDLFTTLLEDYTNPYNYTTSGILEFSADDQLIAQRMEIVIAGFVNYGIVIVDFKNGTIRKEFPASEEEILNMKFTKDGKYFVFRAIILLIPNFVLKFMM